MIQRAIPPLAGHFCSLAPCHYTWEGGGKCLSSGSLLLTGRPGGVSWHLSLLRSGFMVI